MSATLQESVAKGRNHSGVAGTAVLLPLLLGRRLISCKTFGCIRAVSQRRALLLRLPRERAPRRKGSSGLLVQNTAPCCRRHSLIEVIHTGKAMQNCGHRLSCLCRNSLGCFPAVCSICWLLLQKTCKLHTSATPNSKPLTMSWALCSLEPVL